MAGAPPEQYSIKYLWHNFVLWIEQMLWLRRSNVLSKQLTWGQFCEQILHRFSASSAYGLVDRFNAFKQNNLSISEYTDQFEDIMAQV